MARYSKTKNSRIVVTNDTFKDTVATQVKTVNDDVVTRKTITTTSAVTAGYSLSGERKQGVNTAVKAQLELDSKSVTKMLGKTRMQKQRNSGMSVGNAISNATHTASKVMNTEGVDGDTKAVVSTVASVATLSAPLASQAIKVGYEDFRKRYQSNRVLIDEAVKAGQNKELGKWLINKHTERVKQGVYEIKTAAKKGVDAVTAVPRGMRDLYLKAKNINSLVKSGKVTIPQLTAEQLKKGAADLRRQAAKGVKIAKHRITHAETIKEVQRIGKNIKIAGQNTKIVAQNTVALTKNVKAGAQFTKDWAKMINQTAGRVRAGKITVGSGFKEVVKRTRFNAALYKEFGEFKSLNSLNSFKKMHSVTAAKQADFLRGVGNAGIGVMKGAESALKNADDSGVMSTMVATARYGATAIQYAPKIYTAGVKGVKTAAKVGVKTAKFGVNAGKTGIAAAKYVHKNGLKAGIKAAGKAAGSAGKKAVGSAVQAAGKGLAGAVKAIAAAIGGASSTVLIILLIIVIILIIFAGFFVWAEDIGEAVDEWGQNIERFVGADRNQPTEDFINEVFDDTLDLWAQSAWAGTPIESGEEVFSSRMKSVQRTMEEDKYAKFFVVAMSGSTQVYGTEEEYIHFYNAWYELCNSMTSKGKTARGSADGTERNLVGMDYVMALNELYFQELLFYEDKLLTGISYNEAIEAEKRFFSAWFGCTDETIAPGAVDEAGNPLCKNFCQEAICGVCSAADTSGSAYPIRHAATDCKTSQGIGHSEYTCATCPDTQYWVCGKHKKVTLAWSDTDGDGKVDTSHKEIYYEECFSGEVAGTNEPPCETAQKTSFKCEGMKCGGHPETTYTPTTSVLGGLLFHSYLGQIHDICLSEEKGTLTDEQAASYKMLTDRLEWYITYGQVQFGSEFMKAELQPVPDYCKIVLEKTRREDVISQLFFDRLTDLLQLDVQED